MQTAGGQGDTGGTAGDTAEVGQPWWLDVRPTEANAGGEVTVHVTGPAGMPVGDVPLRIVGPDGAVVSLRTSEAGEVAFRADQSGDWRVETVNAPLALRAVMPIRPETPPGTGLWLVPALLLGCVVAVRILRGGSRRVARTG